LLAIPFRKTVLMKPILRVLEYVDQRLFRFLPLLRFQAWFVVIACKGPTKQRLGDSQSRRAVDPDCPFIVGAAL
jgi:hypothetical protein